MGSLTTLCVKVPKIVLSLYERILGIIQGTTIVGYLFSPMQRFGKRPAGSQHQVSLFFKLACDSLS